MAGATSQMTKHRLPAAFAHAREAIAFLERHRLDPSALYYNLAYNYVSQPTGPLAAGINELIDGGIRLEARQADELARKLDASQGSDEIASNADRLTRSAFETLAIAGDLGREIAPHASPTSPISDMAKRILARALNAEADLEASITELQRTREQLQLAKVDAEHDPLTGLLNRRGLEEALQKFDPTEGYAVAVCDVDRFKAINDTYGHATGDNVLRAVAGKLVQTCTNMIVGRWGGEEFLIAAPGMNVARLHTLVDRARLVVADSTFKLRHTGEAIGPITFSAGCAAAQDDGVSGAIERADALCYAAKAAGRNLIKIEA